MEQNAVTSFYLTPITDQGWQVKLGFFPKKKEEFEFSKCPKNMQKTLFFLL